MENIFPHHVPSLDRQASPTRSEGSLPTQDEASSGEAFRDALAAAERVTEYYLARPTTLPDDSATREPT
jgi:hypothetical protein